MCLTVKKQKKKKQSIYENTIFSSLLTCTMFLFLLLGNRIKNALAYFVCWNKDGWNNDTSFILRPDK